MKVALITDGIWPYVLGGMQKHSYYLCKYLAQNKVDVDLYHFNQSQYDISKLEFFSEEEKKHINSIVIALPKSIPFPGHYIYNSYRHSKLIFENIKNKLETYDLIYTKGFTGWYLINQKNKNRIKCAPVGVKFHGYEMFQKPPDFKIWLQHILLLRNPVRSISRKADLVFSYGGKITEIIKELGIQPERIVELPSGVEQFTLATTVRQVEEKIRFLFLGRYERRKGIEELNQAIELFFKTNKSNRAEFHFIGPIPLNKCLHMADVIYHGEIREKEKLQNLIRQCDILICPSWSEGMPNVILEAMAGGLAVIATNVGATNVLVNDNTGWLLKDPAPEEIKDTLERIINTDSSLLELKKKNALDHVAGNFTWEKLIVKFCKRFFET